MPQFPAENILAKARKALAAHTLRFGPTELSNATSALIDFSQAQALFVHTVNSTLQSISPRVFDLENPQPLSKAFEMAKRIAALETEVRALAAQIT